MKTLAFITQGQSDYEDRLRELLDSTGIDPHEFEGLDYFGLLPFFVIAGASIRTEAHTHGDHVHATGIYVEVPEELEGGFYATLPLLLEDAYEEEDEDGE
ncbi:MAG: hypothetical protein M3P40_00295 [Actinomycetota bacterium]|nr:hypothetical protein [Actinomycetota bacterium]